MANKLMPLNYAIIKLFMDEKARCAQDVIAELEPEYSGYKMFTSKSVDEALATAKENGLLDEIGAELDGDDLRIFYRINDYGREMVEQFID